MKNNIEEIDLMIKEALSEEDAKFYNELGEQNLFEMVGGLFQGKMAWYTWITFTVSIIMFGLSIYCFIEFFQATEIRDMLIWGGIGFSLFMAISLIKIFHWLQMDKNALIREMKRMELQIAFLSNRLDKKDI